MHIKLSHQDITLIFLVITIALSRLSSIIASKFVNFVWKWLLCLSTCTFLTFALSIFTDHSRPLFVLFASSFLGYCLIESIHIWLVIGRYSKFDAPLFAKYTHEEDKLVWPARKTFGKIRRALAKSEFKFATTLLVRVKAMSVMSSPIFYSKEGDIRLQLIFSHIGTRRTLVNCILISHMRSGAIFVTHNLQAPIAAFYVPPFEACQRQFSAVKNLINIHVKRIKKSPKKALCLCGENCLQAINDEQSKLEEANIAHGYCELVDGRANTTISFFGRYRLWVKTLLSGYFGL